MSSIHSAKPRVGVRNTRQRTAVVELLDGLDNFLSAKAIHQRLGDMGADVGLTTVYRTLQSLAEAEAVDVLHMDSGETLYRACRNDAHHHHLVCTRCGRTEEIAGGPVEEWAQAVASQYGFTLTGHDVEVFGVCGACALLQA